MASTALPCEIVQLIPLLSKSFVAPVHSIPAIRRFVSRNSCAPSYRRPNAHIRSTHPISPQQYATLFGGSPYSSASNGTPRFTYRIAASYSGKGQGLNPERNIFKYSPFSRLQPMSIEPQSGKAVKTKKRASGQDAFFVSRVGETGAVAFGVADGVGGWADQGIDSADFAHGLCNYMADAAFDFPKGGSLSPKDLLTEGFNRVCLDKSVVGGGSTACVAIGRPDGTMEVANLGDSGFIQLRLNAVRHYSNPQTHAFNTPYQLSRVPPKILAQIAQYGGSFPLADTPNDSGVSHHAVRHGDVLVFATDGVWDNLSSQDTLEAVSRTMTGLGGWVDTEEGMDVSKDLRSLTKDDLKGSDPQTSLQAALAITITGDAKAASMNTKVDGPFAKAVQKQYPGEDFRGGKVDDICVVVAVVIEEGR